MSETLEPRWRQLTARTWYCTLEPAGVNVGLVVGDDAAVLVDAGGSAAQGRALLDSAAEVAGVPVRHVVVTHNHWDHWFGIAGMPGIVSVAHENVLATPASAETLERAAELGIEPPRPSETFAIARALSPGGVRMELLHFGGGHTNSDVLVVVSPDDVVFAGDMLEQGQDPQFDETSNIRNWPTALDGVLGASTEATVFVPGHGEPVDRTFAFIQRAEIGMLHGNTELLIQQGVRLPDAIASDDWPFTRETLEVALPLVYAELEAQGISPRTQLPILGL